MATSGGPDIERDGLVFGMDTSYGIDTNNISSRFYPGEPTINYGENSMSVYGPYWTNIGREGNTHTIYRHAGASSSTIAMASNIFSGLPVGTVTTISGYLYKNGVPYNTTSNTISTYNTTISHETRDDGYFRYTQSLNYANGSWNIHAILINSPVEGDTIILKDLQMEVNTHSTPYLKYNTSRSSTQSLIDLTKTNDIDVSNVSFDSTGQPTFDGTDDIIDTGLFSGRNPSTNPFTVEAILKSNTTSGNKIWVDATSNGSNQRFYSALDDGGGTPIGIQGAAWSDPIPSTTNYIHQTIVMDGSTARSYRNGSASYTRSYTSYTLPGSLKIGGRSGYNWNGEIPVFKLYDRALSADEVQQNYNAYKNRFNL